MKTTLSQTCNALEDSGSTRYRVLSAITYVLSGDLPGPAVFVKDVVVSSGVELSAKNDTFVRVATVADLTTLPLRRDARAGGLRYLDAQVELSYTSLTEAVAAKEVIQQRVDALITSYRMYLARFVNPDTVYVPITETVLIDAAKAKYRGAKKSNDLAQKTLDDATDELIAARADVTRAAIKVVDLASDKDNCSTVGSLLASGVTGINNYLSVDEVAFRTACDTFKSSADSFKAASITSTQFQSAIDDFVSAKALWITATNAAFAAKSKVTAVQSDLSTFCTTKTTAYNAAVVSKDAATAAMAAAETMQYSSLAAADAAQKTLNTSLSEVRALCPDFDAT